MKNLKYTNEEFIEKIKKIHNDKYVYDKTIYNGCLGTVTITCPIHGDFDIKANYLLNGGGCPKCAYDKVKQCQKSNTDDFINKSNKIHDNKYDYSKVIYNGSKNKVCIICKTHGEFYMTPNSHLSGQGCPKCATELRKHKLSMSNDTFIEKSKLIHGNKYDYSKVKYVNNKNKVCIICPIHGEFWQSPSKHINVKHGCPYCNESKLEREVKIILNKYNIEYIQEANKVQIPWIGKQRLDFYLPKYNIAIECQGEQHFKPIEFFGGNEHLEYVKMLDDVKKIKCEKQGVKLVEYIGNEKILENLIKEIIS